MSQINVNRIKNSNEGEPDFPSGVNVGGITSTVTLGVTNLNPTNVNVSGVVTATTLDGNLLATGTPTLGLGVTINASGLNISGVATAGIVSATTLYGDGTNITGIALSIAPLNYNPAVYSQASHIVKSSGIGLTFNQGVKAGSGNVTLSIANAGVAGTVVENFGVGNSVSYSNGDSITITPTADLSVEQDYHLSYPSGAFTNIGGDVSFVGTAYTFKARAYSYQLWSCGHNGYGNLAQNNRTQYSSPVQIPGTNWTKIFAGTPHDVPHVNAGKSDGTLWAWGRNNKGQLGQNDIVTRSSPVQIPGTNWSEVRAGTYDNFALKTDGTLWAWGNNGYGELGQNSETEYSSPVQVGSDTTWTGQIQGDNMSVRSIKTDGTLWGWGRNNVGQLGQSSTNPGYSSPVQIPGTTWSKVATGTHGNSIAIKTDGTLWAWGSNSYGALGQGQRAPSSYTESPVQIPGTNWSTGEDDIGCSGWGASYAIKTDGTFWTWGDNYAGELGHNQGGNPGDYSSPVQVGSDTTFYTVKGSNFSSFTIKQA